MSFFLNYEFGVHHVEIRVGKKAFFKVIDDLSNEFTIYKLDDVNVEYYQIENYYGDLVIIGGIYK